jgi:hypothetical protein
MILQCASFYFRRVSISNSKEANDREIGETGRTSNVEARSSPNLQHPPNHTLSSKFNQPIERSHVRNSEQEHDTSHCKRSQLLYRWTFNSNLWIGFSVNVDFSDLLVIIRGEDVGLDFYVDVDSQICSSSSMVRAGMDFLWMQIFQIC